jgi:hypothetical protein
MRLQTFARLRHRSLACRARVAHCFLGELGFRHITSTPTEIG